MNLTKKAALYGAATLAALGLGVTAAQAQTLTGYTSDFNIAQTNVVTYNLNAPTSNFGTPGGQSNSISYDLTFGSSGDYVYGLAQTTGVGTGSVGNFANIYLSTVNDIDGQGSNLGFEINATGTSDAFIPGVAGSKPLGSNISVLASTPGTVEFAIPFSYFETDPDSLGFTTATSANPLQFRLSQTFGYSVIGGTSNFGTNGSDLGQVALPTPEPSSVAAFAFMGLGAMGLMLKARKRKALDA